MGSVCDELNMCTNVNTTLKLKATVVKNAKAAVSLLTSSKPTENASVNDVSSFASSVGSLLAKEKKAEAPPTAAACVDSDCNNGVCASPNDAKGRTCICTQGFSGSVCDWSAEDLSAAQNLVSETTAVLEKIEISSENADVAIDAVSSLAGDPDLINDSAADAMLNVLESATAVDKPMDPAVAKNVGGAVSSLITQNKSSTSSKKGTDTGGKKELTSAEKEAAKQKSKQLLNVVGQFTSSVKVTPGVPFVLKTASLEVNKEMTKATDPVNTTTDSGAGITMDGAKR